jgi:hypothetical protein
MAQENSSDESLRRAAMVRGSVGPIASNKVTRCLRAPSSFHLRSRLIRFEQLLDGAVAVAFGIERQREIVARLMIVGIGRELRAQRRAVAGLRRLLAQFQFRFDGADRFVGGAVGAHEAQRGTRAFEIAALQIAARQPRDRARMARLFLQHMAVALRRIAEIAGGERFVGGRENFLGVACARFAARQLLHEGADLRFRNRAHEAVDRLAVLEGIDGRDRLDAKLARDLLVLVDIDLDETHRALGLRHHFFERGTSCLQGPHQGAQKSTMTGTSRDASSTSAAKVSSEASLIWRSVAPAGADAAAAAGRALETGRPVGPINGISSLSRVPGPKDGRYGGERKGPAWPAGRPVL